MTLLLRGRRRVTKTQDAGIKPGRGIYSSRTQTPISGRLRISSSVPDVEACDQPPDQVRLRLKQQRSRPDAVLLEGSEHHGRGGGGRQAERQQRAKRCGRGCVVGSLGSCDAFDRSLAEFLGMLRKLLFRHIGQDGGIRCRRPEVSRSESRCRCRAATASTTGPVFALSQSDPFSA